MTHYIEVLAPRTIEIDEDYKHCSIKCAGYNGIWCRVYTKRLQGRERCDACLAGQTIIAGLYTMLVRE